MFSDKARAWMQGRTISKTARQVGVIPRTGFAWLQGIRTPRPKDAARLVNLAKDEGVTLTYEDIYGPPHLVPAATTTKETR